MEVVEDGEDGGEDQLDDDDEEEIAEAFGEQQRGGMTGHETLGVEHLVALLAEPGGVECGDGSEQEGDPDDAAGDGARGGGIACGVKGDGEDDDDEQRKEEGAVDRFA